MIKQNETIEVHKIKLVKSPPEYITCPLCRKNVQSQAVGGHLNFKHNITGVSLAEIKTMTLRGEAKKVLGELEIEGKKRLLDDAVYTINGDSKKEIEDVRPGNPGEVKNIAGVDSKKEKRTFFDWWYDNWFVKKGEGEE